jgi:hypothetical protein
MQHRVRRLAGGELWEMETWDRRSRAGFRVGSSDIAAFRFASGDPYRIILPSAVRHAHKHCACYIQRMRRRKEYHASGRSVGNGTLVLWYVGTALEKLLHFFFGSHFSLRHAFSVQHFAFACAQKVPKVPKYQRTKILYLEKFIIFRFSLLLFLLFSLHFAIALR